LYRISLKWGSSPEIHNNRFAARLTNISLIPSLGQLYPSICIKTTILLPSRARDEYPNPY
jgi:hypothetical protein